MRPTTPESVDWMALQLVRGGAVAKYRGAYLDGGRPLPRFLLSELLFDALLADGLLTLAEPDLDGQARLSLTDTGHAFYRQLHPQRQLAAETDAFDRPTAFAGITGSWTRTDRELVMLAGSVGRTGWM